MRRMARAERSARSASGICQALISSAWSTIRSSVSLRIFASGLTSSAATAGTSSDCTSRSLTGSLTGLRLAMAVSTCCTWPQAMISIRSASDSSGEYSRMGAATTASQVARQPQRDVARDAVQALDLFGQDGAHPHRRIARQTFQRLDGEGEDVRAFALRQARHQARDLHRQFGAHLFILIVGQQAVGGGGRREIGGHRVAGGGRAMGGEIVQHIGAGIGAARQFGGAARRGGADVQNVERVARVRGPACRQGG